MKHLKPLFLATAFALIPALGMAASTPAAPRSVSATCVAFTWSDDGSDGGSPALFSEVVTIPVNQRIELFRTEHAIYQAVVSENHLEEVFLDVLHLDGTRIAGSGSQIVIGPNVAEPGVHVHYECFLTEAKPAKE